nr:MAG TPA: hypothetical protein [Caudoviricetes sp.]
MKSPRRTSPFQILKSLQADFFSFPLPLFLTILYTLTRFVSINLC